MDLERADLHERDKAVEVADHELPGGLRALAE